MKFWLLSGAAVVVGLLLISEIWEVVDWWGVHTRSCGAGCVALSSPWSHGVPAFAYTAVLVSLAVVLVWRAARAYRDDPADSGGDAS